MWNLEDRGPMVIDPGVKVYQGMIIGIHSRDNDLEVNVLKGKKLTNIRAAGKDEAVKLTPPIRMTLERALAWIQDDELVEVTPKTIRLRKIYLDPNERKRFEKSAKTAGRPDSQVRNPGRMKSPFGVRWPGWRLINASLQTTNLFAEADDGAKADRLHVQGPSARDLPDHTRPFGWRREGVDLPVRGQRQSGSGARPMEMPDTGGRKQC